MPSASAWPPSTSGSWGIAQWSLGRSIIPTSASGLCWPISCTPFPALQQRMPAGDWACMLLAASACIYFILELDTIIYRVGVAPTSLDLFFSTVIVVLILEMTRRTNGWILPSIAIFFLAYALLGKYLPYSLGGHRGYSFARVFSYITGMDGMLSHRWRRRPRSYSSFFCSARSSPAPGQGSSSSTSPWPLPAASAAGRPRWPSSAVPCSVRFPATRRPTWWPPGRSPSP